MDIKELNDGDVCVRRDGSLALVEWLTNEKGKRILMRAHLIAGVGDGLNGWSLGYMIGKYHCAGYAYILNSGLVHEGSITKADLVRKYED